MPVPGTKPKGDGERRRRNAPTHEWTEVLEVPFAGPRLPAKRPSGKTWPKPTREWWKAVSTMPHCSLWSDADWRFAIETAGLVAELHESPTASLAGEIRQREKIMGTTLDARRDLRIRYVRKVAAPDPAPGDEDPPAAEVTRLDDYRDIGDL